MEAGRRIVDVSRLLSRLHRRTPTGIDRVEFAYARHYLRRLPERGGSACFVVTTPLATGVLRPDTVRGLIDLGEKRWMASDPLGPAWARLREIVASPLHPCASHRIVRAIAQGDRSDIAARLQIGRAYAEATARRIATETARTAPGWYLHVSHANLHAPARLQWLKSCVWRRLFLLHDLIPLSHPEYFPAGEDARHQQRMRTVARCADLVVFNSRATQVAWDDFARAEGVDSVRGCVVPLGIEEAFLHPPAVSVQAQIPYFVVVGTIEARKNLAFLLEVWKQWIALDQPQARLIVVGRRRAGQSAFALMQRGLALHASVIEVQELADAGLATLLRGARALLAPSLIEGFGLPIAEALALGVPVIASAIAAHREVGADAADYLDPLDGHAWLQALRDYAAPASARRQARIEAARTYRALSWQEHIETIEELLKE